MQGTDDPKGPEERPGEAEEEVRGETEAKRPVAPEPVAEESERLQILRMVREGKVTPEQGVQLLDALGPKPAAGARPRGPEGPPPAWGLEPPAPGAVRARVLRIRVYEDGQDKVRLNIPMGLARSALRLIPASARARLKDHLEGVDLEAILDQIQHGATGKILEVRDDDDDGVDIIVE